MTSSASQVPPAGFSWVDEPNLAGMARPSLAENLQWLRQQGIEVLISLTEYPLRRQWVNDAGLLSIHVAVDDMTAPTQDQLAQCLDTIHKANEQGMGVAVHCGAGLGRTGTVLACYFVDKGTKPADAISKVRRLRPGSVETKDQEDAVAAYAERRRE